MMKAKEELKKWLENLPISVTDQTSRNNTTEVHIMDGRNPRFHGQNVIMMPLIFRVPVIQAWGGLSER